MDKSRRTFLRVIFIGSGVLLAEKILTPLFSFFSDDSPAKANPKINSLNKTNFREFQITEDKKKLSIYDSSGEEILQIDKEV
ncbi:MAG: hypothetical protein WC587_02170 [Candidatus Paceibacterota bacterium]